MIHRAYHLAAALALSACGPTFHAQPDAARPDASAQCTAPTPAPGTDYSACSGSGACGPCADCLGLCTPGGCVADSECPQPPAGVTARPFCRPLDGRGLCLLACTADAQCPAGTTCAPGPGGVAFCQAP